MTSDRGAGGSEKESLRGVSENLVPLGHILGAREHLEVPNLMPPVNWVPPQRNNVVHDVWNPRSLGSTMRLFVKREGIAEFGGVAVSTDRLGVFPHVPSVVPRRGAPILGEGQLSTLDVRIWVPLVVTLIRLALTSAAPRIKPIARSTTDWELSERETTVARGTGLHTQKLSTSDSLWQLPNVPRHTPSPKELAREGDFGFGSEGAEKESLPPRPSCIVQKSCVASRRVPAVSELTHSQRRSSP